MFSRLCRSCIFLYKLLLELFSTFCGTIIHLMLSLMAIIFGLLFIWSFFWVTNQIIYQVVFSSSISWIAEKICLGLGIGMLIIGFLEILQILSTSNSKRKFILTIIFIITLLLLGSMIFIGNLIISDFSNSKLQDDFICKGSSISIPILMYNNIAAKSVSYHKCTSSCLKTFSTKLLDCESLQLSLNVINSSYPSYYFDIISSLENTYKCAGICKTHEGIPCTFFDNFSNQNTKNCYDSVHENLSKYIVIILCLFSASFFTFFLTIIATVSTIIGIQKLKLN